MKIISGIMLSVVLIFPLHIYANNDETVKEPVTDEDKTEIKRSWGILGLVLPGYSPDTGWTGSGGVFIYNYTTPGQRPDELSLYGQYSQRRQASAGIITERYYCGDRLKFYATAEFSKWPSIYWGVGSNNAYSIKENEKYTALSCYVNTSISWEIYKHLYIGTMFKYRFEKIVKRERVGFLALDNIPGSKGAIVSGIGFDLNWDTRDSTFYTLKGFWLEVIGIIASKKIGSKYNYSLIDINYRHYFQIYNDHVIAMQLILKFNFGTVPLQEMPGIGNQYMMRGYVNGRYADKTYCAFQAEYRFPIFWRFGGVLFVGIGEVDSSIRNFNFTNIKIAPGIGIRVTFDKDEHINMRFDVGFDAKFRPNYYLAFKEAF